MHAMAPFLCTQFTAHRIAHVPLQHAHVVHEILDTLGDCFLRMFDIEFKLMILARVRF